MLLDQILLHAPFPIFWKDMDGVYLGCNEIFLVFVGFQDYDQLIGKKDEELPWGKYKDKYYAEDKYVTNTCKAITSIEDVPVHGRIVVVETTKAPLMQDGKIIGVVGICLDITDRQEKEFLKLESERQKLENTAHKQLILEQEKAKRLASQAVHDIGSPLSSLRNVVQFTNNMSERERLVVITAINSINDIAHNLLNAYTNSDALDGRPQDMLVSAMLLQTISNKRYEYKDSGVEFKVDIDFPSNFSFIYIDLIGFQRMISNLINNAVDALEGRSNKEIEVSLSHNEVNVAIIIRDNGKGMSKELMDSIKNNAQKSYDKQTGHGIGWRQIHDTLEHNFGKFAIYSTLGESTKIVLTFPRVRTPSWIADAIQITKDDIIVVLDDESSIHSTWDARMAPFIQKLPNLKIKHFSVGTDAIEFINNLSIKDKKKVCLLTDYELKNQSLNGLDIVKQTGIKRVTVVTTYYADIEVRELIKKSRVRILPKELVFAVSIMLNKKTRVASRKVDMVWIDDNMAWVEGLIDEYYRALKIDKYEEPISFLEDVQAYPLDTKIILDMFYTKVGTCNLDGFEVAKKLHDMGYNKLYMAAGEAIKIPIPDYLKVIYKDDIIGLGQLDKL